MGLLRRFRHEQRGQALVEIALTLPVICAFAFMIMEVCLMFYSYCMISETARQGARFAMVHGNLCVTANNTSCTTSAAGIKAYTEDIGWPNIGGGTLTATATLNNGDLAAGHTVTVLVNYAFPINLPFVPPGRLGMKSSSTTVILQ